MKGGFQGSTGADTSACFGDVPTECIPVVLPTFHWGGLYKRPSSIFVLVL